MSLLSLYSPNLARTLKKKMISASFKMFLVKKWKSKSLTNSRDFYPDPPNNEKYKSSVFWMNQTILIIFVFFLKTIFFWLDFGPRLTPASQQRWINPTIFLNFFLNPSLSGLSKNIIVKYPEEEQLLSRSSGHL